MDKIILFITTNWLLSIVSSVIAIILCAVIADHKGRRVGGWSFGGIILGWLGVIIVALLSNTRVNNSNNNTAQPLHYSNSQVYHQTNYTERDNTPASHTWRCSGCRNMITTDPCPICGRQFSVNKNEQNQ